MKNAYGKIDVEVIANDTPVGSWFIESNDRGVVAVFTVTSDIEDEIVVNAWAMNTKFEEVEKLGVNRRSFDAFLSGAHNSKLTKVPKQVALDLIDNLKGNYHD